MESFSVLLALCAGNSWVASEFPSQRRTVTWSFDVVSDIHLKNWVSNRDAGDLRRRRAHYDVTAMESVWQMLYSILCMANVIFNIMIFAQIICVLLLPIWSIWTHLIAHPVWLSSIQGSDKSCPTVIQWPSNFSTIDNWHNVLLYSMFMYVIVKMKLSSLKFYAFHFHDIENHLHWYWTI